MANAASPIDPEALLAHAGWLRALARSLVNDPDRADDVAQEAWLAAVERPPREPGAIRAWLRVVARRTSSSMRRDEQRRTRREERVAKHEATPDPAGAVERFELLRRLVEQVGQLEEPYRTAVLLRYFEGMTPAEIALRTGRPAPTIRSHLHRALARLRERLDAGAGGRAAWVVPFLPWIARPAAAPATGGGLLTGGLIVSAKTKVALAVVVLVLLSLLLWRVGGRPDVPEGGASEARRTASTDRSDPAGEPSDGAPPASREVVIPEAGGDAGGATPDSRDTASEAEVTREAPVLEGSPPPPGTVVGRVRIQGREDATGVTVRLGMQPSPDDPTAGSDPRILEVPMDGEFRFDGLPPGTYSLEAIHDDYAPHARWLTLREDRGAGPYDLVLLEGATLVVRVLGIAGEPLPDQTILVSSGPTNRRGMTDADGVCRLDRLREGFQHVTWREASAFRSVPVRQGRTTEVDFSSGGTLRGSVFDGEGGPFHPGVVRLRPTRASPAEGYRAHQGPVGPEGRFEIRSIPPGAYDVTVQRIGAQGSIVIVERITLGAGEERQVSIRLRGTVLCGRVVRGPEETPVPMGRAVVSATPVRRGKNGSDVPAGPQLSAWPDADGRFRIEGPAPGRYRVRAHPMDRRVRVEPVVVEVPEGGVAEEVVLRLEEVPTGRLRLRVLLPDGKPAPSFEVVEIGASGNVRGRTGSPAPDGARDIPLEVGRRRIAVLVVGHRSEPRHVDVTIEEGRLVERVLKLVRLREVRLRVLDAGGRPAPAATFHYRLANGALLELRSRRVDEGLFALDLEPTTREILVGPPGASRADDLVAVSLDGIGTSVLDVRLAAR